MKLFDRARKVLEAFTPAPLAPAQEYRILCRNGHRLRGDRTEGYQALRCQSCNELFFVLPKSPLPTPAGATAKFKPKPDHAPQSFEEDHALPRGHPSGDSVATVEPLPEGSQVDGEIDWVDDTTVTSSPETTSEELPKAREPAKKRRNSAKPTAQRADPVVEVIPRERWVDWAKRKRNPLIFSAVMLLVLTTVWVAPLIPASSFNG